MTLALQVFERGYSDFPEPSRDSLMISYIALQIFQEAAQADDNWLLNLHWTGGVAGWGNRAHNLVA